MAAPASLNAAPALQPSPPAGPPPDDPTPHLQALADVLQAFRDAGSPPDRLPAVQGVIAREYQAAGPSYWQSAEGQPFAHRLQSSGFLPAPKAPASPGVDASPAVPLSTAVQIPGVQPPTQAPAPPPMVPMAAPASSDLALRQQVGALHDAQAAYNAKIKQPGDHAADVQAMTQRLNQHIEWVGANGHADDPGFQQFLNTNRALGWRLNDPPKPGQPGVMGQIGGYLSNVALPDAEANAKGLLRILGGLGDALDTEGGGDVDPAETAKDRQALLSVPAGALAATGVSSDPNDRNNQILYNLANAAGAQAGGQAGALSDFIKGVPQGVVANTEQHPVGQLLNVLPFALHGAGAVAGAVDAARVGDTIRGADLNPTPGQFPDQIQNTVPELHPTAPIGPNQTLRGADGRLVSPSALAAQSPAAEHPGIPPVYPEAANVPAADPVQAARRTVTNAVLSASQQGIALDPGEVHSFIQQAHGLTPDQATEAMTPVPAQTAPPPQAVPPQTAAPVQRPAPVQNTPPVPAGEPQAGVTPPAGVSSPPAPAANVPHPDDVESAALARIQARQAARAPAPVADPRLVPNFPVDQLRTDPERFQYKVGSGQGGQTGSLSGAPAFNQDLAGVVHAWRDPADGVPYVVNGHNRYALAQRTGQTGMDVRFIDAATADDARTKGAMINIAEGQGTAIDAAKLFRDKGMTPETIAAKGISLKGQKAAQGIALSNLSPSLFGQVVRGELPIERGALIGDRLPDVSDQQTLTTMLDKYAAKGKTPTNDVVSELADQIRNGPKNTETTSSLFGDDTTTKSAAMERAEVAAYIKGELGKEGSAFGGAARNAGRLARGNNVIDAEQSARIAQNSRQGAEIFERTKNASGPVSDILNAAARRIAKGENANAVKSEALRQFQDAAPGLSTGTPDPGAGGSLPTGAGDGGTGGRSQPGAGTGDAGAGLFGEDAAPSLSEKLGQSAQDAADRISARNRGRASSGVDPADLADMAIWGAARLAKGAVDFGEWSRQMVGTFGDAVRPHLTDLYAEAQRQHAQIFGPRLSVDTETAPAAASAAPVPSEPAAPARTPAEYTGSVNIDRMGISDAAKQVIRDTSDRLTNLRDGETLSHDDAAQAAQALGLTPDHLRALKPGEVPGGVHPAIFNKAVADLHAATAEKAAQVAEDTAGDTSPGAEARRDQAQADQETAFEHHNALRRQAGQTLGIGNSIASPLDSALEKAAEKQQALARVSELRKPENTAFSTKGDTPNVATPKQAGFGAKNQRYTRDKFDSAVAELTRSLKNVQGDAFGGAGVVAQSLPQLKTIAGYYIEGGVRKFADFAAAMRSHAPALTDPQVTQLYAGARADFAETQTNGLKKIGQQVFPDAMAPQMGRRGASDFITDLADAPYPDLLGRLLDGELPKISPLERAFVNERMRANMPPKGKGVSQESLSAVKAISKEFADRNRKASLEKARAASAPPKTPKAPPDAVTKAILGRVGRVNGAEFFNRIGPDLLDRLKTGQALTDAEKRAVAAHLDDLKPDRGQTIPSDVSKTLTQIARDAKAGRLGFHDSRAVMGEMLKKDVDPARLPDALADLSAIPEGDKAGLRDVYARHSPAPLEDKIGFFVRSNLLSGLFTFKGIVSSHLLGANVEDTITRAAAAMLDPIFGRLIKDTGGRSVQGFSPTATGKAVGAGLRSLPAAADYIKHGPTVDQLSGMAPDNYLHEMHGGRLETEPINGVWGGDLGQRVGERLAGQTGGRIGKAVGSAPGRLTALPLRLHGAAFKAIGDGLQTRGAIEAATLKARRLGTDDPARYLNDADVKKEARAFRQAGLYLSRNMLADMGEVMTRAAGPIGKVGAVLNLPFLKVPLNVISRGAEYSGAGIPAAVARGAYTRFTGRDFASIDLKTGRPQEIAPASLSAADRQAAMTAYRRNLSLQAGRGVAGAGVGIGLGYGLTKKGALVPPNEKEHERGHLNVPSLRLLGHTLTPPLSLDTSRLNPPFLPLNIGGELANRSGGLPYDLKAPFLDNPYSNLAGTGTAIQDAFDGSLTGKEKLYRVAGRQLAALIPFSSFWSQIAGFTDPSGQTRRQVSPLDAVKNAVPGPLHNSLPTSGFPQANNAKAVGAGTALMSPVGVRPQDPTDTPAVRLLRQDADARRPQGGMSAGALAAYTERQGLVDRARAGKDVRLQLTAAIRAGRMTEAQANQVLKEAAMTPAAARLDRLPLPDALDVYEKGSAAEKAQWQAVLLQKIDGSDRAHTLTPSVLSRARSLGVLK